MEPPGSGCRPSRREFLKAIPLAVALGACGPPYRREDFVVPPRSAVGLFPATRYDVDLADVIARGLDVLQPRVKGRRVFLKINLVEYAAGSAINTDPLVVAGAAAAFLRAGASEVVVGEGPGHRRDIEYLLTATGLYDHLRDARLRFVDLNADDVRRVRLRSHFTRLGELWLPAGILQSDFLVSVAKLKTHHWAAMTASLKNLFGVVPGSIYGWPKNLLHFRGIDNSILDLAATVTPQFSIVDAIVAMEGDGPIMGRPRATGFVAMGSDAVAVDATCARIMGLDPARMRYLSRAARFLGNLAEERIEQRGEAPARYRTRFDIPPAFAHLRLS